jgi:outer membrane protein assembly factor BamB
VLVVCAMILGANGVSAGDWPQWRGPNRDGKAAGFTAPKAWPEMLTKKWQVPVGDGVATPALVGDKLYVFSRQEGNEVLRCLDAVTGNEVWQEKYPSQGASGPAAGFSGPRASPTVVDGKVVTLGVRGTLSCLDTATGKVLWRKDDFKGAVPRFCTACSPIVVDGLCIAQLGGEKNGGIIAYDLASGDEKWKWTEDGTAYASPVAMNLDGTKVLVAETANNIVALGLKDGKLLWKTPFAVKGRGYNATTPIVAGNTVIYTGSGRGAKAVKLDKSGEALDGKEVWSNTQTSVQFNTPIVKNGLLFGISDKDNLFCLGKDGNTAWSTTLSGRRGYGSVVDLGTVLMALTPSGQLVVFEPSETEFKQLAMYKLAEGGTYAYPVVAGNRVFVKDRDSLTLWMIE